ncbi:PhzF family phenazine biosynthesis protein [Ochrobactrum sp. 19YEA23]|uniref:PhzF family phenazine biosynthesis isomerase n=1 Tax=Ochrobactrum sp. 19YEA23 TaxID=3039854 RepID=UPI00247A3BA0|nr:PhzF family phenazine biosynthesis protein [Ochrobactrum sp. 19YEA23]
MRTYRLYQIDAFTRDRFTGNPAGVVPDATGLSDMQMQEIAREMNVSETAFIFPTKTDGSDMTVRFFTPATEVPICGHATISAHWVRAHEGAASGIYMQNTGAGILPVEIERKGGSIRIWMTQRPATFGDPFDEAINNDIRTALGITDFSTIGPVQIVSTGHSKVMVPLTSTATLHGLSPDLAALSRISEQIGCNGFFTFVLADRSEDVLAHGRMFAPAIGIPEDPVTGNACGPLGAYLARHALIAVEPGKTTEFTVRQGEAMGRPGLVKVEVHREGETFGIRIAGEAVPVFSTSIELEPLGRIPAISDVRIADQA